MIASSQGSLLSCYRTSRIVIIIVAVKITFSFKVRHYTDVP